MSVAPVTTSHPSLYEEHIPQCTRSLTDTANVKVSETALGKSLIAARDISREGEIIYLEFVPCNRVLREPTKYSFRKQDGVHLDAIGAIRFINHR